MNSGSCLVLYMLYTSKTVESVLFANVWFKNAGIFHNGETRPAVRGLLVLNMGVMVRRETKFGIEANKY
jgi:hypothetical protein